MNPYYFVARNFVRDLRGAVALIFAVVAFVLIGSAGMAVDFSRKSNASQATQKALDVAVLAVARRLSETDLSDHEAKDLAQTYFDENIRNSGIQGASFDELNLTIDRDAPSVQIDVAGTVETTISRVFQVDSMALNETATARFNNDEFEIALMWDMSGSMSAESKRLAAKASVNSFLDVLMPEHVDPADLKVRVGLAPYSDSVNAGPYATLVTNSVSTNDCVSERVGPDTYTDAAPGGVHTFGTVDDEEIGSTGIFRAPCPDIEVLPLTNQRQRIIDHFAGLNPYGETGGHLGTAWAYYLISPNWSSFWPAESRPAAYNDSNVQKVAVLMTDGAYNKEYRGPQSFEQAGRICDEMKTNNIMIFFVAFGDWDLDDEDKQKLKECVSADGGFYDVADNDALVTAYSDIANRLLNLRLSE